MVYFVRKIYLLQHKITWLKGTWTFNMVLRRGSGLKYNNLAGSKKLDAVQIVFLTYRTFWPFCNPHSHMHTCTVLCTTHTVHALWAEVMRWDGSCFVIQSGKNWMNINSSHLHLLSPLQKDHHSRTCRTGSCQKMWRSLAPGHTQSENEILWSLYVTVHYAKCDTLSHICRRVLFPQCCRSADLKIKRTYIYMLLIFSI